MKAYKLTNEHNYTRNNTQWGENITHTAEGTGDELCTDGWIHFYTNPFIAIIMNPQHADFYKPNLWECESSGEHLHETLKSGCKTLTTTRQIPLPEITDIQLIAFAILCAKEVFGETDWNDWANKWLSGEDRSAKSISAAKHTHAAIDGVWCAARYSVIAAGCIQDVVLEPEYSSGHNSIRQAVAKSVEYAADAKPIDIIPIVAKALTY